MVKYIQEVEMKQAKQRVIALDYFRGICILIVLLNHSAVFSTPYAYLTGIGRLWTSAAEIFFLISGITLGVVRGPKVVSNFREIVRKSWSRATTIYLLYISLVVASLLLAYFFSLLHWQMSLGGGELPADKGATLLYKILSFSYGFGWAGFLMYYSVFLLIAPFSLYILRTRFWATVPLMSLFIFLLKASPSVAPSAYSGFAIWQLYFFIGLTLARFRQPIISRLYSLPKVLLTLSSRTIIFAAALMLSVSSLLAFSDKLYWPIFQLARDGWLPVKLHHFYTHLLYHYQTLNFWLGNNRFGVLRPLITLLVFAGGYLFYQRHKEFLLKRTGNFVNTMGKDTLWIFAAQALVIPVIAAPPLPRNIFMNTCLTALLFYLMWLLTQRAKIKAKLQESYRLFLRSYYQAQQAALYNQPYTYFRPDKD
jgi:hypothetical protein